MVYQRFLQMMILLTPLAVPPGRCEADESMLLTMTDESQLYVQSADNAALSLETEDLRQVASIPLSRVKSIETKNAALHVRLKSGANLIGKSANDSLQFESLLGTLRVPVSAIRCLESVTTTKPDPAGTDASGTPSNTIRYAGLDWLTWRTLWDVQGSRLSGVGQVRPGFNYGHWGHGRGGLAITGNGSQQWKDYEVVFDYKMLPATKEFFHATIPGETRGMHIYVRAKSMTESWNEPDTAYIIGVNPTGGWSIAAYEGFCYAGPGWTPSQNGKVEHYTAGKAELPLKKESNRLRIRVVENSITLWLNDECLTEFKHPKNSKIEPITYGGVGVEWRMEALGWIENFEVEHLDTVSSDRRSSRPH